MLVGILIFPLSNAYGHGLGFETISGIDIGEKEISVTVELPMFSESEEKQLLVSATEKKGRENVNFALSSKLSHDLKAFFGKRLDYIFKGRKIASGSTITFVLIITFI